MKHESFFQRYRLLWIFLAVIGIVGVFEIAWLIRYGNTPQVYTDVVLEELGAEFSNKSIEMALYWVGMAMGLLIIAFMLARGWEKGIPEEQDGRSGVELFLAGFMVLLAGKYIFYGSFQPQLLLAVIPLLYAALFRRKYPGEILCCYFLAIYAVTGIYRLYAFLGGSEEISITAVGIFALALTLVSCSVASGGGIRRLLLVLQFFVPFLLLIYLTDRYEYGGEIIRIRPEKTVYALIFALIAMSLLMIAKNARDNWDGEDVTNAFSMWVPVAVIAFQRFSGSGNIMPTDMHHPAENTIAFNEIANLGRAAFSEYVPVSGLYGFVQGMFLEAFGNGDYTGYAVSNNVYYLVVIILLVAALRLHVSLVFVFLGSLFISVSDYSRVALVLPFMLFLLSWKLIDHANAWSMAWVVLCLCYGLYYPAYGAAVLVAMVPLGIYQIPRVIDEYRNWPAGKRFAASCGWLLVLAAVALAAPLLAGTLEHVLAMGDGMLYVDGVTVFGKSLPGDFLGCLKTDGALYTIRLVLGYVARFSGPMLVVWIAACAFFQTAHATEGRTWKNIWFKLTVEEMSILACLLFSVVCFYFSLYRMGAGTLFNRTVYIINYAAVLLIVILYEYDRGNHDRHLLIYIAVFAFALCNLTGIDGLAGKYYNRYRVAEDYVYTEGRDDMPNLGEGFVQQDQMQRLEDAASRYGEMDHERNYYALFADGLHGMAYDQILNIRGCPCLKR